MTKLKILIFTLVISMLMLPIAATATETADGDGQLYEYYDYPFELPEYDAYNLIPEQKEMVDLYIAEAKGSKWECVLMFKANFLGYIDYYWQNQITGEYSEEGNIFKMFEDDMPIEEIIGYHINCPGKYHMYYYNPEYNWNDNRIDTKYKFTNGRLCAPKGGDIYDHALIKTAIRDDLFSSVKTTENYSDIEILRSYFNSGIPNTLNHPMTAIFLTNHGIFVFYKYRQDSADEYLFPVELVYKYADSNDMQLEKLMENDGVDLSQYIVSVPSNGLPLPTAADFDIPPDTADPSVFFAAMSLISAGGFTLFAVKRKKKA